MYPKVLLTNHWMEDNLKTHLKGVHLKKNLPRKPPFNPHGGSFGWPTFDMCMFIPPWYQPHVMQLVSELTTKLPHMKLQYLTMSKTLTQMFTSKCSRRPLKLMVKQWKLTSSTCLVLLLRILYLNGEKTMFKTIQIALLKSWNKHFANDSKL